MDDLLLLCIEKQQQQQWLSMPKVITFVRVCVSVYVPSVLERYLYIMNVNVVVVEWMTFIYNNNDDNDDGDFFQDQKTTNNDIDDELVERNQMNMFVCLHTHTHTDYI